jgi:hypothetical protein
MVPAVPVGGPRRGPVRNIRVLGEELRAIANEVNMGRIEPGTLTEERARGLPFEVPYFATPGPQRLVFVDKDKNVKVLSLSIAQHALLEHENARLEAEGEPRLHTIEEVSKFLNEYYDEVYAKVKPINEAAAELNAGAASTSWCTGASVQTARSQIEQGDFYIYYKNGKPEVAVRMNGQNEIGEVRGNTESQGLTNEQEQIAKDFLSSTNFKGAQSYITVLERKQSLLKVLKGDVNPEFLMTLGPYVDIDGANETTVEMLLNFSSIDGEMFVRRPDPTKELLKATGDALMDATEKVMADGYFPGMKAYVTPHDNNAVFSFKGKKIQISVDNLVAAGKLYFYLDEPVVLPNLKHVNAVQLEDDTDVSLPQINTIGLVEFKGNNNVQVLRLADNAVVGTVAVSTMLNAVQFAATKTRGIIKNATIVDNIETNDGNAALELMLPDAIYAPVVSAKGNERIIADSNVEQFRKFIRELNYKYQISLASNFC